MPPAPLDPSLLPTIVGIRLVQQAAAYIYAGCTRVAATGDPRELVYCRSRRSVTIKPAGSIPEECGTDYVHLPSAWLLTGLPMVEVQHIESIQSNVLIVSAPSLLSSVMLSESTLRMSAPLRKLTLTLTNRSRAHMEKPALELQAIILDPNSVLNAKYTKSVSITGTGVQACQGVVTHQVAEATPCFLPSQQLDAALTRLYANVARESDGVQADCCTICLEQRAVFGINGCGHRVVCAGCLTRAMQCGLVAQRRCPLCRSEEPLPCTVLTERSCCTTATSNSSTTCHTVNRFG